MWEHVPGVKRHPDDQAVRDHVRQVRVREGGGGGTAATHRLAGSEAVLDVALEDDSVRLGEAESFIHRL